MKSSKEERAGHTATRTRSPRGLLKPQQGSLFRTQPGCVGRAHALYGSRTSTMQNIQHVSDSLNGHETSSTLIKNKVEPISRKANK